MGRKYELVTSFFWLVRFYLGAVSIYLFVFQSSNKKPKDSFTKKNTLLRGGNDSIFPLGLEDIFKDSGRVLKVCTWLPNLWVSFLQPGKKSGNVKFFGAKKSHHSHC